MPASEFYEVDALAEVAINLFYGWGFNFYPAREPAPDRRHPHSGQSVLAARRCTSERGGGGVRLPARQDRRADPCEAVSPTPDVIAAARLLETLSRAIGALEGQIRAQPAPESDRMSELYRRERDVLTHLCDCDYKIVGQAELLRSKLDRVDAAGILALRPVLEEGLAAIAETLRDRRALFLTRD